MRRILLLFCLALAVACPACADPREDMAASLDTLLKQQTESGRIVGTVVLVSRRGELLYHKAMGLADREAGQPMREDTLVRLASMTKPLVSAAAMVLIEQGRLGLEDTTSEWLPGFSPTLPDGRRADILVRHLLTHTAGLSYGFAQDEHGPYPRLGVSDGLDCPPFDLDENLRRINDSPLFFAPGTQWRYSLATDVLGAVLMRAAGQPLPDVVRQTVTGPLGMTDTTFTVTDPARLSAAYATTDHGVERMGHTFVTRSPGGKVMTFCPDRILDPAAPPSGGAGMAGTASDYLKFLEALRTGGGDLLSPLMAKAMTTNAIGHLHSVGPGWSFGFGVGVLADPAKAQAVYPSGCWFWGGVYGSSFWVDPANGLTLVILTNTAPAGDGADYHELVRSTVYKTLGLFPKRD